MKSTSPSNVAPAVQTKEKTQVNKTAHRCISARGPGKKNPSDRDYVPPRKKSQLIPYSSRKSSRSVHTSVAAMSGSKRSLYVNDTDDSSNTDTELSNGKSISKFRLDCDIFYKFNFKLNFIFTATTPSAKISKSPPNKVSKTDAVQSNGNSTGNFRLTRNIFHEFNFGLHFIFTATTSSAESVASQPKPSPNKVLKTCGNDTLKKLRELLKKQACMYCSIFQFANLNLNLIKLCV